MTPPTPPKDVGVFENEIGGNLTDKMRHQVHSPKASTENSSEAGEEDQADVDESKNTKAEIITRIIGAKCKDKGERKEALEWIKQRKSKNKSK